MDSIYKGLPFGTLLFWRTKTPLKTERKLGPFALPKPQPNFPIDYILDGQQRATSIFGVFQSILQPIPGEDDTIFKIYFDLTSESSIQDSNFIYVPDEEVEPLKHFPLRLLFNPPEYRKYLKQAPEDICEKVDILYEKFTHARIPVQIFETDDRAAVAIVFERINRLGVELDTLQLLSAWTWSEDFDLQEEFSDLAEELEPFGFKAVGKDSDLLLRCCAAIIDGDASPNAIIRLNGEVVRARFGEIKKGIYGTIDFLRSNCKVVSSNTLPFSNIIVPLSVFFATSAEQDTVPTSDQQEVLLKWVWRTFFSRRYSKRLDQLNSDISLIKSLKEGKESKLGDFQVSMTSAFFLASQFNLNTVNTKVFILLLANKGPLNFISGSPVALDSVLRDCNKKEFHHIYPRKFLTDNRGNLSFMNSLVNFAIIGRGENNRLGGIAPSKYRTKMPKSSESTRMIMEHALCPESVFEDNFEKFLEERTQLLMNEAHRLMKIPPPKGTFKILKESDFTLDPDDGEFVLTA